MNGGKAIKPFDWSKCTAFGKNGQRENRGLTKLRDGCKFQGEWLSNMKDGRGIQIWPNGSKYEGLFRQGRLNGYGRMIHAEGDIYEGEWVND